MIDLPDLPGPTGVEVAMIDFGIILRPATGAALSRINRAGSRYRASFDFPPMKPDTARIFNSRFMLGKREGLRIEYPLLDLNQGNPGNPVVDGAGQSGTSLVVRNLAPGYVVKEGYPLTLIDSVGRGYLYFSASAVRADTSGDATLALSVPLRHSHLDGAVVKLAKPTIEGVIADDVGWSLSIDRLIRGSTITLEEAA